MKFSRVLWSDEELAVLREFYPVGGTALCLQKLPGRNSSKIRNKVKELDLLRDYDASDRERFESAFVVTPSCWLWQKHLDEHGYGRFAVHQVSILAHRYSFEMYRHPIPEGMFVCHRCDNPQCVNPDHFFLGTAKDNAQDMMRKGRDCVSKLSPMEVAAIRCSDEPAKSLAERFSVSLMSIYNIKSGKTWASLL